MEGGAGLVDRSSRPHRSPNQTPLAVEERVAAVRRKHKVGPVQLVALLAEEGITVPASTIYRILVRHGISRLRDLDVTGEDLREPVHRTSTTSPAPWCTSTSRSWVGSPPAAGGGSTAAARRGTGSARAPDTRPREPARSRAADLDTSTCTPPIDDHSRLAYTEELLDEKGTTAAAFCPRAVKFFRRHGIKKIQRVLTDNGACYRSLVFAAALATTRTRHKCAWPDRPQTNGKVERFHRTLNRPGFDAASF